MVFEIVETSEFVRSLRKLDPQVRRGVWKALLALTLIEEPTVKLKPLRRTKVGLWRLRVGDYRVILDVRRDELVIIAIKAGHRSVIYDG